MANLSPALANLIARLEVPQGTQMSEFGPRIISALVSVDEYTASSYASEFLVSQVESMILIDFHPESTSQQLAYTMGLEGFMTLRRLEGLKTPAAWLHNELTPVLGEGGTVEFIDMIEYMLTLQFEPMRIDEWLIQHFVESHASGRHAQPKIVHIASEEGAIEVLAPLKGLTRGRVTEIAERVVVQTVNENRRFRNAMRTRFDFESAAEFEAKMYDAQQFHEKLTQVVEKHVLSQDMINGLVGAGLVRTAEIDLRDEVSMTDEDLNPRLRQRSLLPDDWQAR